MFRKLGKQLYLFIKQRPHTVWNMLLMRPVYRYALLAVTVITAGFLAGTVIFILILFPELGSEFFLKSEPFFTVSFVKFFHCVKFFLISLYDHLLHSFSSFNFYIVIAPSEKCLLYGFSEK